MINLTEMGQISCSEGKKRCRRHFSTINFEMTQKNLFLLKLNFILCPLLVAYKQFLPLPSCLSLRFLSILSFTFKSMSFRVALVTCNFQRQINAIIQRLPVVIRLYERLRERRVLHFFLILKNFFQKQIELKSLIILIFAKQS